jgi:cysteine desulfurase
MIYLDANASVPPRATAREALLSQLHANPSSPHGDGRQTRRLLDDARHHVATALGASHQQLYFTSGATESNRWLVDAITAHAQTRQRPLRVVTSPLEHASVRKPLLAAAEAGEIDLRFLPLQQQGIDVSTAELADADVVYLTAAHNETGVLTLLDALAAALPATTMLIVDAAQSLARLPALPARVDAAAVSAHKVGGFAGSGALLLRGLARALRPPWVGGGQEAGVRPGTEAWLLHGAFGAVCAEIDEIRAEHAVLGGLRDRLERSVVHAIGGIVVGGAQPRLANTTAITIPDVDGEALRMAIDGAGIAVGFGAACSAMAPEPSSSLLALGLDADAARCTVRFSLPPTCTVAIIDSALQILVPVLLQLQQRHRLRVSHGR